MNRSTGTLLLIACAVLLSVASAWGIRRLLQPAPRIDATMDTLQVRRIEVLDSRGDVRILLTANDEPSITYCTPTRPAHRGP